MQIYRQIAGNDIVFGLKLDIINILPLDNGVMVDYHTKKKLAPETKCENLP